MPSAHMGRSIKQCLSVLGGGLNLPGQGAVFLGGRHLLRTMFEKTCHYSKKRKKSCFGDFEKTAKNVHTFSEAS